MPNLRKLADTVFKTGPQDSVAAADIYTTAPDSKPATAAPTDAQSNVTNQAAQLFKSKEAIGDLAKSLKIQDGKVSVDTKDLMKRIQNESGELGSPLNNLQKTLTTKILKAIGLKDAADVAKQAGVAGLPGSGNEASKKILTIQNAKVLYGTVTTIVDSAKNLKNATDVVNLLNSISGNSTLAKLIDKEAQFAVFGNLLQQVSALGIPDAIDLLLDKLDDDKERRRLLLDNLRSLIMNSDMPSVRKAITYVGGAGILSRVPDAIPLIMTFYQFAPGTDPNNYAAKREELIGILNDIDAHWFEYSRNGTWISNLEPFTYASDDALLLCKMTTTHFVAASIGPDFRIVELVPTLQAAYPKAVF